MGSGQTDSRASDLLTELRDTTVPPGQVRLWWLGQAGFLIQGASGTVIVDAFLSDFGHHGRLYPPPLDPADLTWMDMVLGTHNHLDHIDPIGFPAMMAASTRAVGVVPAPVVGEVTAMGVDPGRLVGARVGEEIRAGGFRVVPLPAAHADDPRSGYHFHLTDGQGEHPYLGYYLETGGVRLFHAGDTIPYEGFAEQLRKLRLDALMLPINGVSWFREERGVAGNMNIFEAAELGAITGAKCLIPMHHDLFADNSEDVEHLISFAARQFPSVRVLRLERGVRQDLGGGAP
jgi:L-ascorbate metabolism protein UlaG (beta-lactamase superfamily)